MSYGGLPRDYKAKSIPDRPNLKELLEKAKAAYEALSPEEKEAHDKAQRDSWIRGEMALGLDDDRTNS